MKYLTLSCLALVALSAPAQDLKAALTQGKVTLEIRPRFEYDEDSATNPSKSATALTNRTILGYTTGSYHGVKGTLQFLDVSPLFEVDRYNNEFNNKTNAATIAEPHQDRILQCYLEWKGLKVGRQTLSVDNQRFIGGGAWSQSPKSFTAATFQGNFGLPWMELHAGYITDILLSNNTHRDVNMGFARIRFTPIKPLSITPFFYAADVKNYSTPTVPTPKTTSAETSYKHMGVRADGSWQGILYEASYARQQAFKDGTEAKVPSCNYYMGMLGYKYKNMSLKVARESLEKGYNTPDAALHGFYGYSDRIGATPTEGLVDTYLLGEAKAWGFSFEAQYHWFNAETDHSLKYGKELNLMVSYPLNKQITVLAKYADYVGDGTVKTQNLDKDLRKFWLQTTYKF